MSLKTDSVARCAHHLQSGTVAGINVCDHSYGMDGWCTRKAESLADSLLVVWLLWPRGPLSSDCHSWGLWDRFLQNSHSSKLTPPTKPWLPRPTSHCAICPERWKDRGLKLTYIFIHWYVFFCLSWLIHQSVFSSLIHFLFPSSILSSPTVFFHRLSFFISATCLIQEEHICNSPSPTFLTFTSEGIIH